MTISKLINELTILLHSHGDIEVGIVNGEYDCFEKIDKITYRKYKDVHWKDDESLGESFIGIE